MRPIFRWILAATVALFLLDRAHDWLRDRDDRQAEALQTANAVAEAALSREKGAAAARDALRAETRALKAALSAAKASRRAYADTVYAAAPDTCAPYLATLAAKADSVELWADSTIGTLEKRVAGDSATISDLGAALELIRKATDDVEAPRPSFLSKLLPDVNVGVGPWAGVDFTGRPTAGVGVGVVISF